MILQELVGADVHDDGGSYEAAFTTDDGVGYGLWLDRPTRSNDGQYRYRWLFEYHDYERPQGCIPVVTGSDQERELIERLRAFLEHPVVHVPFAHRTPKSYFLECLAEMLEHIIHREPCLPEDLRAAGYSV
jgi:hypothetical protein